MTGRDLCAIAACASVVLGLGLPAAAQSNPNPPPRPGDWVVVTQNGAVYVAEPGGSIRSHVSGSDWRFFPPSLPTRGSGPQSGLQRFFCPPQINGDSRLVARTDETNSQSLLELDLFTGQRYEFQPATFAPGEPGLGIGGGFFIEGSRIISVGREASGSYDGVVVEVDLRTGARRVLSGPSVGAGPIFRDPVGVARLDSETLLVVESSIGSQWPYEGLGLYVVDVETGDRRLMSRLSRAHVVRDVVEGGALVPRQTLTSVTGWNGGTGPTIGSPHAVAVAPNGLILVSYGITYSGGGFDGGLISVSTLTADRHLLVGKATDEISGLSLVRGPSNVVLPTLDFPGHLTFESPSVVLFACVWGPPVIYRFHLIERTLEVALDLRDQLGQFPRNIAGFHRWQSGECLNPADLTTSAMPGSPGYGVPDGVLTPDDFFYFLNAFANADPVTDLTTDAIDGRPEYGRPDGVIDTDDFFYFLTVYTYGC